MADPIQEELHRRGMLDLVEEGIEFSQKRDYRDSRLSQLIGGSVVGDLLTRATGGHKSDWERVLGDETLRKRDKAAYAAARVAGDFMFDGTRTPYWLLNHPLAALSLLSQMGATAAGLTPNYRELADELQPQGGPVPAKAAVDAEFARRMGYRHSDVEAPIGMRRTGIPAGLAAGALPVLAATAMVNASGNHDLMNLAQGGRSKGYAAILPQNGSLTETSNVPLELLLRYVVGRSGRLLPWEQFTQERPDVSPQDYAGARRDQFDRGPLGIGLIKGTTRNVNGEPEYTMMGFRVPMSAAASGLGAIGGAIGGAKLADHAIGEHLRRKHGESVMEELPRGDLSLRAKGNRRLLGAVIGALAGSVAGRGASDVVNEGIIQPALHPDRVAAEKQWLAGAAGRTLEQRIAALEPERLTPAEELPDLQRRRQNQQQIQQQQGL